MKITLNNISAQNAIPTASATINNNNDTLEVAFDNTLSRDGTSPNQMGAPLDMNSHSILNLPYPASPIEPLRLGDVASAGAFLLPPTIAIGNIAFFATTSGKSLGAIPTFQSANPGSAALYSNVLAPVGSSVPKNGLQVSIGPAITSTNQFGSGGVGLPQAIVGTVDIAASDTTTGQGAGIAGYAVTHRPAGGPGAVAVGVYGQAFTDVPNANVFGANFIAVNASGNILGFDTNYMAGIEVDCNVWKKTGGADPVIPNLNGIVIAGGSNLAAMVSNSSGYALNNLNVVTNAPWNYGYSTYDSAALIGVHLGTSSIGNNTFSQPLQFRGRNSAGVERLSQIRGDANGSLLIAPNVGSSLVYITDGIGGSTAIQFGAAIGNARINVPTLSTAGVITNNNSGTFVSTPALSQTYGGFGSDVSTSNGIPIFTSGTPIMTGVSGGGLVALVNSPAFISPNLGTPTAVILTNATGTAASLSVGTAASAPVTGLTGTAAGIITFLTTPTSANLKTAVTDETGSGALVFATSPTLVTPVLGAATATTINGAALDNLAWTAYSPTITSATGTPTTTSATGRYKQIGKTVFMQVDVIITTIGTAAGGLRATIPVPSAAFSAVGSSAETVSTGKSGASFMFASGTYVQAADATNTTYWANGNRIVISMAYEAL